MMSPVEPESKVAMVLVGGFLYATVKEGRSRRNSVRSGVRGEGASRSAKPARKAAVETVNFVIHAAVCVFFSKEGVS